MVLELAVQATACEYDVKLSNPNPAGRSVVSFEGGFVKLNGDYVYPFALRPDAFSKP